MPVLNLDFTNVETYENLPINKYYGSIDAITYREASEPGKFPQIQVTYLVTDGDLLGKKSSEFLSLSPNAAFRLKKWFDRFGLGDEVELEWDEDTNQVTNPDLIGYDVIFEVYQDPKLYKGERQIRTRLVELLEEIAPEPEPDPAPRPAPAPSANRRPAPVTAAPAEDEAEPEAEAEEPEAEDEPEEAPAPKAAAPARRQFTPQTRPATAATSGPARRPLR